MKKRILEIIADTFSSNAEKVSQIDDVYADYSGVEKIALWREKYRQTERKLYNSNIRVDRSIEKINKLKERVKFYEDNIKEIAEAKAKERVDKLKVKNKLYQEKASYWKEKSEL